ncbi:MAG: Flagellar biosynthesis regulator FlhF, partial [Pelotomaculum thermopropionicum]
MKIKRYVVREMQEAVQLIKQDLGPEAIIVSSYKVPAKG